MVAQAVRKPEETRSQDIKTVYEFGLFGAAVIGARCGGSDEHLADPRPVHLADLEAQFTPRHLLADVRNVIKVGEDQSCQGDEVRFEAPLLV
jgi:hypothetical protein